MGDLGASILCGAPPARTGQARGKGLILHPAGTLLPLTVSYEESLAGVLCPFPGYGDCPSHFAFREKKKEVQL